MVTMTTCTTLTSVIKAERLAAERPMSEHTVQTDDCIATNLGNLLFRAVGWDMAEVKGCEPDRYRLRTLQKYKNPFFWSTSCHQQLQHDDRQHPVANVIVQVILT